MLLCIFDFNEDYTGIRVKYYKLNLEEININIFVNIKSFTFKEYFGITFYDSFKNFIIFIITCELFPLMHKSFKLSLVYILINSFSSFVFCKDINFLFYFLINIIIIYLIFI